MPRSYSIRSGGANPKRATFFALAIAPVLAQHRRIMARILITGGCGFIGSNLAVAFRRQGDRVVAFDNLSRRGSEILLRRVQEAGADFVRGDIRNPADLEQVGGPVDLLVECSAEPSVLVGVNGDDAEFMVQNNLVGSLHCFEFARKRRAPVIFLSTSRVYPYDALNRQEYREEATRFAPARASAGFGPDGVGVDFPLAGARSLYGATKLASEIMLQEYSHQYGLPAVIDRCGVVAGPWQLGKQDQGVFTHWLVSHRLNRPLAYIGFGGQGKQVRDLLHIDDLVDLVLLQSRRIAEFRGDVFPAGGSTFSNLSLREATDLCQRITGRRLPMSAQPENRPADVIWFVTDNRPTTARLGWRPTRSAETILRDVHAWLDAHPDLEAALFGKPA
ncbi:MAG TPA: NAD-dependent epimerase/dehydratase family protein [Kiritimatiellia bacterium]|nr:NAD-dependent epimerase/dehydratase family protein [Kiritimatiellia bacterium]